MSKLRNEVIKLAHDNPELRADLLPLLEAGARSVVAGGDTLKARLGQAMGTWFKEMFDEFERQLRSQGMEVNGTDKGNGELYVSATQGWSIWGNTPTGRHFDVQVDLAVPPNIDAALQHAVSPGIRVTMSWAWGDSDNDVQRKDPAFFRPMIIDASPKDIANQLADNMKTGMEKRP